MSHYGTQRKGNAQAENATAKADPYQVRKRALQTKIYARSRQHQIIRAGGNTHHDDVTD